MTTRVANQADTIPVAAHDGQFSTFSYFRLSMEHLNSPTCFHEHAKAGGPTVGIVPDPSTFLEINPLLSLASFRIQGTILEINPLLSHAKRISRQPK
jgi:hypothetical protein